MAHLANTEKKLEKIDPIVAVEAYIKGNNLNNITAQEAYFLVEKYFEDNKISFKTIKTSITGKQTEKDGIMWSYDYVKKHM